MTLRNLLITLSIYCSTASLFFNCNKPDSEDTKLQPLGQTITPNKIWNIESGYPCPEADETFCFCYYGLQTIKVGNTKIFNGKEYYELLSEIPNQQWKVLTYVREEGEKVFFYIEYDNEECLMYDYGLNIDDEITLKLPWLPDITDTFKVTEIDSIDYNGIKRKRIRLENLIMNHRYDYWVEGIGCMRGITYLASAHIGGGVSQLKDCYESNELIFVNENPEYCWVSTTNK